MQSAHPIPALWDQAKSSVTMAKAFWRESLVIHDNLNKVYGVIPNTTLCGRAGV